jgi:hypothetical protein
MQEKSNSSTSGKGRRSFMKKGLAAGTATMAGGLGLLAKGATFVRPRGG